MEDKCRGSSGRSEEQGRMNMNKTLYSMISLMVIVAFVALLWGTVGYIYADSHPLRRAVFVGGGVLISGWLIVLVAAGIKISRLRARRRESNSGTD